MKNHRTPFQRFATAVFTASLGVIAFSSVAGKPRFQTFHVLDVIRLMTAGAAVAVTIMLLIKFFISLSPRADERKEEGNS